MILKSSKLIYGKVIEGALPLNQSHDDLRGQLNQALGDSLNSTPYSMDGPYVRDVFPKHVVYSHKGQTHKQGYTAEHGAAGSKPKITLKGSPKKVHVAYMDNQDQTKESLSAIMVPMVEDSEEDSTAIEAVRGKSVYYTLSEGLEQVRESISFEIPANLKESDKPTNVLMKLIGPGWGSSAYYSPKVLKEAAPVFAAGTHMMWNHQSASEEVDRPEGDLSNLAAVLTENSRYMESGPKGPGLYAKAKVFSDYAKAVAEKGPHIGVSINAGIKGHVGEAEGKHGMIADQFMHAYSADFVTKAGAKGAPVVSAIESARVTNNVQLEVSAMTDQEAKDLLESNKILMASVTKLTEAVGKMQTDSAAQATESARLKTISSAISAVSSKLHEAGVTIKPRLLEAACAAPVLKDGVLDEAWVSGIVADFMESVVGSGGEVRNMGTARTQETVEVSEAEALKVFEDLGMSKDGAKIAMKGGN